VLAGWVNVQKRTMPLTVEIIHFVNELMMGGSKQNDAVLRTFHCPFFPFAQASLVNVQKRTMPLSGRVKKKRLFTS